MTKQRKWFKRIGLALLAVLLALVLAVGGYVLYLQTGYYRIPDGEVLAVENPQTGQLAPGQDYTALTYNIGFGAYGPDYSFFMDTGTMADGTPVQGRWGKAKSKESVLANVRTAKRLGAKKVSIVYRRRVADMTALPSEIEGAVAEGIEVLTLKAPSRIEVGEDGAITGIYVTPQMISKIRDGRASVRPTGEEDILIPCQTLIVAIGQDIEYQHFEEAGVPVSRGKILTEKDGGFENIPGVFAGGDCASGPASVIKAIAAAKVVAANIDEYLGFHHEIKSEVKIPEANLDDREPCGRVNMTEREACERVHDFEACENCMTEAEAKQEASRCLRCDHFGYGIFKGGRNTLW